VPRTARAIPERRALGRRIRAHRLALGLASRDVAAHIGSSHSQMTSIETTSQDVLVGTLIDVAAAVGLQVALAADHHLPLLDLTADEVQALITAADHHAADWAAAAEATGLPADQPDPHLLAALDKTRPTTTDQPA
jgi:transcriptional regulator with XRE-family HTH domain